MTDTLSERDTDIAAMLDDLDLLDDDTHHCRCLVCNPHTPPYGVYVALCGTRSLLTNSLPGPPPNACEKCLAMWQDPCPRCGNGGSR